jgi:uncharacterized damage-inducible protein DinB
LNTLDILNALYRHMEWADASVARVALASEAARADEELRGRFRHLHLVQQGFLHVWLGRPFDPQASASYDLPALVDWAHAFHAEVTGYLAAVKEGDLEKPMPMPWAKLAAQRLERDFAVTTFGETILQVPSHSTYHRGQVNTHLRELGCEPPLVDFIAWTWFGKPAAEWPGPAA